MSGRQSESSSDESKKSVSAEEDHSSDDDFGVVEINPYGGQPYQDEPLAIARQEQVLNFEEDRDGIPVETLASRFTKIIPVSDW